MKKIIANNQMYFVTCNIHGRIWVFVRRKIFTPIEDRCDILIRNLKFYREKYHYKLHGLVIMPDHIHMILTTGNSGTISDIMRDIKHRSAYEINRITDSRGTFWQNDFWEHSVRNEKDFREKMNYIHDNPVRAGYVTYSSDWKYSSAGWYEGKNCPIGIDEM